MKKILLLALTFAVGMTASAQLLCSEKGKQILYKQVDNSEKTPVETVIKTTVIDVVEADGKTTVRIEAIHPVPDNSFAEVKEYWTYVYDAATDVTKVIPMTADDLRAMIINVISEAANASNQHLSEMELKDIEKMMSVKGELEFSIDPQWAPNTKLANSTMRLNAGQMTLTMNIWDGMYLGVESVTTEAGTFECAKVSYVKRTSGPDGNEKSNVTEWYAKGVGLVKSVETDKKGKILSEETIFVIK